MDLIEALRIIAERVPYASEEQRREVLDAIDRQGTLDQDLAAFFGSLQPGADVDDDQAPEEKAGSDQAAKTTRRSRK